MTKRQTAKRQAKPVESAAKPQAPKRGRGRPTTYRPELCSRVIELGAQGMSECEISREIETPRSTMQRWAENQPEFAASLARAKELSQAWWEAACRDGIRDKAFNAQLWLKTVASRFRADYAERQTIEHTGPNGGPIEYANVPEDQLDRRLSELMAKAGEPVDMGKADGTVH